MIYINESPTGKKIVKVWSVAVAVVVEVVMPAARAEVAAAAAVVVLISPLTLYRRSTTVLIHFVLKLIFPKNKKR